MIKIALNRKSDIYDFRGVPGLADDSNGLYRFKKGFNARFVEFIGLLFYKDKNGNNLTIPNEPVNITIFYQNGTNETRTYITNATGNFVFNFRKEFSHDNFTIGFAYFGSDRYISYDFRKVFDDKISFFLNNCSISSCVFSGRYGFNFCICFIDC